MTYNTFHVVHLKDFINWSVLQHVEHEFNYSDTFPLAAIGKFLAPNQKGIDIQDDIEYKQITVRIKGGGVFLRTTKFGKEIGTKHQWIAKKGQFILSRIDARNGAMGIVPDELDGAIVTHDFPLFDVNTDIINPHFLLLIIITDSFMKFAQSCSSGTTNRQRINVVKFLQQRIPLPSIETQNAIVGRYNLNIAEAKEKLNQSLRIYASIDDYIHSSLGISLGGKKLIKEINNQFIAFTSYKCLKRWDVWNERTDGYSLLYKNKKFGDILSEGPKYGANVKGVKSSGNIRYIRITDICEDGSLNDDFISPASIMEKYFLKKNDFLIARSGNTVGKTFLYEGVPERAMYAGYLVKYRINERIAIPKFVLYFTKTSLFKSWIVSNQRISGQPNINGKEYLNFPIPIPPLNIQNEIVDYVSREREKVRRLQANVTQLRERAKLEFEQKIFKNE